MAVEQPRMRTLRDYLSIGFRRKWLLIIPMILAVIGAILAVILAPPRYLASVTILRKEQSLATSGAEGIMLDERVNLTLDLVREEILNQSNLRQIILDLKINPGLGANQPWDPTWERAYWELRQRISMSSGGRRPDGEVILVEVEGRDPEQCKQISGRIADLFVNEIGSAGVRQTEKLIVFLGGQEKIYFARLHLCSQQLADYRAQHPNDLPEVKAQYMENIVALDRQIADNESLLEGSMRRLEKIEEQLKEVPPLAKVEASMQPNPRHDALLQQLEELKAREARMRQTMKPEHPALQQVAAEIQATEEALARTPALVSLGERMVINEVYEQLDKDRLRAQQDIQGYKSSILMASENKAAYEARVKGINETAYLDLRRQKDMVENTYNQYAQNLQAAKERLEGERQNLRQIVSIVGSYVQLTGPNKLKLAVFCLVVGLTAALGLLFTAEFFDNTIRTGDEAAEILGLPVLGSITVIVTPREVLTLKKKRHAVVLGATMLGLAVIVLACGLEIQQPGALHNIWSWFLNTISMGRRG